MKEGLTLEGESRNWSPILWILHHRDCCVMWDLSSPSSLQIKEEVERLHALMQIPFLLSPQVFLIIHHAPLVNSLADVILNGDLSEIYAKTEQDVQRSSVSH